MSNFSPLHEVTMYQARCTNCGTVEDDYGDYSAWGDPSTPVDDVIENHDWFGFWKPNGKLTPTGYQARELAALLCPECQTCEVCGAKDAREVNGNEHLVCCDHEDHDFAGLWQAVSTPCLDCGGDDFPCNCETPNPTEPSLSDDELIGVRGLLQERYGDQTNRADVQDAEMWRAFVSGDVPRGLGDPDLRGGNRTGAAAQPTSPVSETDLGGARSVDSAAGDSAGEVCGHSPRATLPGAPNLTDWLEPAALEVLANHTDKTAPFGQCWCAALDGSLCEGNWDDDEGWQEHVAYVMSAHIAKALEERLSAAADDLEQSKTK